MRVALYARVSTEEQAKHGLSIDAQLADLRKWAKENGHTVAGEYIDAGISGKKPYTKRPALSRFMEDLQSGAKVDALVFTKLDRFYRSVKLYYQAIEIMDRHKTAWIAIQEDYETITASGRFKVNIMLSVAENEADRTSERIKAVFEHKVAKGEFLGGRPQLGYKVEGKKLVPDENTVDAARGMFRKYLETASYYETARWLTEQHGLKWDYHFIRRMLSNPIYIGEYRGNTKYCEPIIPREEFEAARRLMKDRSVRFNQTGRIYLFSGLIACSCCGLGMVGFSVPKSNGDDYYYRCSNAVIYRRCNHTHSIREERLERWMLEHVSELAERKKAEYEASEKKRKRPKVDRASIEKKLDRLKDLYVDGLITKEQYKADREKYMTELQSAEAAEKPTDHSAIDQLLGGGFLDLYHDLERKQRREFWRGVISKIYLDADNAPRVVFR